MLLLALLSSCFAAENVITLYPGFITKVRCEGKLFVSSIGNDQAVKLEALPQELGCAVFLKPLIGKTKTNLILETSTGTIRANVVVSEAKTVPHGKELLYQFEAEK